MRGCKLYITLIYREMSHFLLNDLVALILDRTIYLFSYKYNINNIIDSIISKLAFQKYFQKLIIDIMNFVGLVLLLFRSKMNRQVEQPRWPLFHPTNTWLHHASH